MNVGAKFAVVATRLNLRSAPRVAPGNRLAVLNQGHLVEKVAETADQDWWRVSTNLNGLDIDGFVARRFLANAERMAPPFVEGAPSPVHLREEREEIHRGRDGGRAFPLGEAGRPGPVAGSPEQRRALIGAIIAWLDVETSARYKPKSRTTYCNIYAYDFAYCAGAYLPRVWWTDRALVRLAAGESVAVRYDETVRELNANNLCDWFEDFGTDFGWQRVVDANDLQSYCNEGRLGVICAQRTDLNRSGHIAMVVAETDDQNAQRRDGRVTLPMQSQAGLKNFCYGTGSRRWWAATQFAKFGFWAHLG